MSRYTIQGTGPIQFAPENELEEIFQNVRTILSTPKGSVPLGREFGIDLSYLDSPTPVAEAKLTTEIIAAVKRYEPRVSITAISFTGDAGGKLKPVVEVRINGTE